MWTRQDRFQASPMVSKAIEQIQKIRASEVNRPGLGIQSGTAYLCGMAKSAKELPRWRVTVIKGKGAIDIGTVRAPDADKAIKVAIQEFEITDLDWQKRLAAGPVT